MILLVSAISCESDVDLGNEPPFMQKLIISGFISPSDSVSYFDVTTNKKIFGELNTEEEPGLLTGTISDGTTEVSLEQSSKGLKIGHDKMQILHGLTYLLKIRSSNGLSAEASCTVPFKNNFSIVADTFSLKSRYSEYDLRHPGEYYRKIELKANFTDVTGEENYYRIFGITTAYFTYQYGNRIQKYVSSSFIPFDKEFFSDKGTDGKIFTLKTGNTYNEYNTFFSQECDSMIFKVYLYNTEKSYYLFHKSLADYNDGENPFTESSPVYSNINGGSGIFTSYTVDSVVIKYK